MSENAEFARVCGEEHIKFIGPSPEVISRLGDKAEAKRTMKAAGVPVVPGSDGPVKDADEAKKVAEGTGFPILIKASAGGGGRGMRIAESMEEVESAYNGASMEAEKCFGDGDVYVEKLIKNPRHV